jgi:hypothetical protein
LAAAADDALCATLHRAGGAWLVTEPSANTFPRLPVRSGEWVVVGVAPAPLLLPTLLLDRLMAPLQTLRLTPTRRSRLS